MNNNQLTEDSYRLFTGFLSTRCGIVLGENKQYLVKSRLTPLVRKHKMDNLNDFVRLVVAGTKRALQDEVVDAMTTNETLWFRDNYPFQILENEVLPRLAKEGQAVNIWSAACSSGQEPFSISMLVREHNTRTNKSLSNLSILATDISAKMLQACKTGIYDSLAIARGLDPQRQKLHFINNSDGTKQIRKEVLDLVNFQPINLIESRYPSTQFDVIFCRNVLIYFSNDVKLATLQKLAARLKPNGILFLGASESIAGMNQFLELVRSPLGLYYVNKR